jgi:hypothetical protein
MATYTIELTRKIVEKVEAKSFEAACEKLDSANSDQDASWAKAENEHVLLDVEQ